MDSTTVRIGEWSRDELNRIKEKEDHSSIDSVIKTLILIYKATQEGEELERS